MNYETKYKIKVISLVTIGIAIVSVLSFVVWYAFFGDSLQFSLFEGKEDPLTNSLVEQNMKPQPTLAPSETPEATQTPIIPVIQNDDKQLISPSNARLILLGKGKEAVYLNTLSDLDLIKEAYNNDIITMRYRCFTDISSTNLPNPDFRTIEGYTQEVSKLLDKGDYSGIKFFKQQLTSQFSLSALDCSELNAMMIDAELIDTASIYLSQEGLLDPEQVASQVKGKLHSSQALIQLYLSGGRSLLENSQSVNGSLPGMEELSHKETVYVMPDEALEALDPTAIGFKKVTYQGQSEWEAIFGMHEDHLSFVSFKRTETNNE